MTRSHRHGHGSRSREVYGRRENCQECSRNDADLNARMSNLSDAAREYLARTKAAIPQNQQQYTGAK